MLTCVFRVDASITMGSGHVMRCLTLAERLYQQGATIIFLCRELPGHMCQFIEEKGYTVHKLPYNIQVAEENANELIVWSGETWQKDADQTGHVLASLSKANRIQWLIVDHYGLDIQWEQQIKSYVEKIMVIDDLANRQHDCEMLLDQNLYMDMQTRYNGLIPEKCTTLLGPQYAILRREFYENKCKIRIRNGIVKQILVFLGGSDPTNETTKALKALQLLKQNDIHVDVVVGNINPNKEKIKQLCGEMNNTTYHCQVNNMAELMSKADLAIGGGGSVTWERLCLGLPSLVLRIADNQERLTEHAEMAGVLFNIGDAKLIDSESLAMFIKKIIIEDSKLRLMSKRAIDLVDGLGLIRVVKCLNGSPYRITIVSDKTSWINTYINSMSEELRESGYIVNWIHNVNEIEIGDIVFYLSCSQLVPGTILKKNKHNLVVHESELPKGRGWSPLTWQILEGKNNIPISLFEAEEAVDSGQIYLQKIMRFSGTELLSELRKCQAKYTIKMCMEFINRYPNIIEDAVKQKGNATYYSKRAPEDSRLDIDKTIREQVNLLRVVDNDKYPAFIEVNGCEYFIKIYRKI